MNVLEMCFRSFVGVSRMEKSRNEVSRRGGMERELASIVNQRALRWFGHVVRKGVDRENNRRASTSLRG